MRPTDMWEVTTSDGHPVRATLIPEGKRIAVAWFIDAKVEGAEDFEDWEAALRRAGELRMAFLAPKGDA
jgi:hypothetical protein